MKQKMKTCINENEKKSQYNKIELTVLIPIFNEEDSIEELYKKTLLVLRDLKISYEFIFIDDGSTDSSLSKLKNLRKKDDSIKIIQFRRNFGKSSALEAGFNFSRGDFLVTMDGDLQDDPSEIPRFIKKAEEGFDLVSGWKKNRQDSLVKIASSKIFNLTVSFLFGIKLHDFNCGFKIYKRELVDNLEVYGEMHRFMPALAYQKGYSVTEIPVKHHKRLHGVSKYGKLGFKRLKNYLLDPVSILLLTKYSRKPLHFFGNLGLVSFFSGFLFCFYLTTLWFLGERPIGNRPLLFLGILLIIVGIQLIFMGLLGEIIIKNSSKKEEVFYIKKTWQ